jgi:hypothetical protein
LCLLGREVGRGAHDRARLGEVLLRVRRTRDAEVGDLDPAGAVEQNVAGLHVAVHHAVTMGERERAGDVGPDVGRPLGEERALAADDVAQRAAFDVLHHDEVGAGLLAGVVHRHDVGMVQSGGRPGFTPEALDERAVGRELGEEHLERDAAIEQLVVGDVDLGHSASRQVLDDLVASAVDLRGHGPEPTVPQAAVGRARLGRRPGLRGRHRYHR